MKVEVKVTSNFKKQAKPLLKKYPLLISELDKLENELTKNPKLGKPLGSDAYKIRLSIKSKGRGKSGGARVITHIESEIIGVIEQVEEAFTVNLLTIYDKSDTESITDKELKGLIKNIR
ncbi:hypothetical protein I2I11_03955 [Pontibacter sp. 172403-2]|uniref:hypothetical protein n=1 Tax=Pontibacter rufus TaxID=2791028 RepID=UPI0018AFB502|nr:hypothetical protein [Pontibacter sp. 172403-2]MBF9252438.1 hypothetical protein [Pontibacter sp. 172403-2]